MPTLINALLPRAFTTLSITPQTVSSSGVTTDSTPVANILTQVLSFTLASDAEVEKISPITSRRGNNVIVENNTAFDVSVFLFANDVYSVSALNRLRYIGYTSDYAKLIWSDGSVTQTFYGVISKYSESAEGKGKVTASFRLEMIDTGTANPVAA